MDRGSCEPEEPQPDKHYPPPSYGKPLTTKQFERRLAHSSRRPLSRKEFDGPPS